MNNIKPTKYEVPRVDILCKLDIDHVNEIVEAVFDKAIFDQKRKITHNNQKFMELAQKRVGSDKNVGIYGAITQVDLIMVREIYPVLVNYVGLKKLKIDSLQFPFTPEDGKGILYKTFGRRDIIDLLSDEPAGLEDGVQGARRPLDL